jgi:hypothetical protein
VIFALKTLHTLRLDAPNGGSALEKQTQSPLTQEDKIHRSFASFPHPPLGVGAEADSKIFLGLAVLDPGLKIETGHAPKNFTCHPLPLRFPANSRRLPLFTILSWHYSR